MAPLRQSTKKRKFTQGAATRIHSGGGGVCVYACERLGSAEYGGLSADGAFLVEKTPGFQSPRQTLCFSTNLEGIRSSSLSPQSVSVRTKGLGRVCEDFKAAAQRCWYGGWKAEDVRVKAEAK